MDGDGRLADALGVRSHAGSGNGKMQSETRAALQGGGNSRLPEP
jgi:hypothetical protein